MKDLDYMIEVMQAAKEGKKIEYKPRNSDTQGWHSCIPKWDWIHSDYRVANTEEELKRKAVEKAFEQGKHIEYRTVFGWETIPSPSWYWKRFQYRIKLPEYVFTNKLLESMKQYESQYDGQMDRLFAALFPGLDYSDYK